MTDRYMDASVIETHHRRARNRTAATIALLADGIVRYRTDADTIWGMPRRLRSISPATVIALVALFVSLTGTATAITLITGRNVKDGSLTGQDVKDGSLTRADLSAATLAGPRGPAGPVGAAGEPGEPGLRGPQGIEGVAGTDPWDPIPSGQLVTGSADYRLDAIASEELAVTVQLQARAPVALTTLTVNFSTLDLTAGDGDASCTGTETAPTAPAGRLCLYVSSTPSPSNVQPGSAYGDITPDGRTGFTVHWQATAAPGVTEFAFTWAYRAP